MENIEFIRVGSLASEKQWIYLCGLTNEFDSEQEVRHRRVLDVVGRALNIGFIAVRPAARSSEFGNCLCWPHNTKIEVLSTYDRILKIVGKIPIAGWIGFSNGGFFLNRLVEHKSLKVPIISIGASGWLSQAKPNRLFLAVGKDDMIRSKVEAFYHQMKGSVLKSTSLHLYDGGHEILQQPLLKLMRGIG